LVIIIMIVLIGLFLYLYKTEQRLKKIEKEIK
jgi:CcmD family protein